MKRKIVILAFVALVAAVVANSLYVKPTYAIACSAISSSYDGVCTDSAHNQICHVRNGEIISCDDQGGSNGGNDGNNNDQNNNGVDPTSATGGCNSDGSDATHFMGLRAWYDKLPKDGNCNIKSPENKDELSTYVWTIVLNLATMLLQLVGYLAVGFVIWGGYQYIMARGEPAKVASGRKTIVNAIIGLIVCMTASIITGAIGDIVASAAAPDHHFFGDIFNKAFFWAGIVAVIFMVYGGIQYVTSSGDTTKITKAKNTIMNAAIGLVITILAAAIVNLVINALNGTT